MPNITLSTYKAVSDATECPFSEGTVAAFNSEPEAAGWYFNNIAGLFIVRQFSWLEMRDELLEVTDACM